jgi:AbiEi antitoxin C-terminal domain
MKSGRSSTVPFRVPQEGSGRGTVLFVTTTTPGLRPGSALPRALPDLVPFRPSDAAGRAEARHLLDQHLIRPVIGDVLVAFDAPDSTEVRAAAALLLLAREAGGDPRWVVGFSSAAWLHAGPAAVGGVVPARLEVILENGRRRPRGGVVFGRQVALPREHVTGVHGVPVTTPVRTAADVARDRPPEQALIALRRLGELCGVRPHQVLHLLADMRYARGAANARTVIKTWAEEP